MRATCLLAGLAVGCGARLDNDIATASSPDAAAPVDAGVAPLTATAFIAGYGDLLCNEAFVCQASYPPTTTTFAASWGASVSDCDASTLAYFNAAKVEIDVAKGRIAFDPLAAAACLSGIAFGTCGEFWQTSFTYPDACNHALVGSVANGGGCVSDFECASLYCTSAAKCAAPT